MLFGQGITLGRSFQGLSANEKEYIVSGLKSNSRSDGRSCLEWRTVKIDANPVPQVAGSSRVSFGRTEVLVSIKGDIGRPLPDCPNEGQIICSVDCASMISTSKFYFNSMGVGGLSEERIVSEWNHELTSILNDIILNFGGIDLKQFGLLHGEYCWILYLDALVLDFDGNLIDSLVLAARQALLETRLPIVKFEKSGEISEVMLSEELDLERQISSQTVPFSITIGILESGAFIVDPTGIEEMCCESSLIVSCLNNGKVVGMRKLGMGTIDPGLFSSYVSNAIKITHKLDNFVILEHSNKCLK